MKRMHVSTGLFALLFAAVLGVGCRSSGAHDAQSGDPFRTLLYGYQSGLKPGSIRVARDDNEWRELWSEHTSTMLPRPEAPTIDWQKQMVVCIALGQRPTAGYGIEIDRVEHEGRRLIVEAHERKPAPDAVVPQVITHPYVIAVMPRSDGDVELKMQ
jgi:hypothetical protein